MTASDRDARGALVAAVVTATVMIAFQTAGKATREALFLSAFIREGVGAIPYAVEVLPRMMMAAALISVVFAFLAARWMTAVGPGRLVPVAFTASAALLLLEWALVGPFPRLVAVVLYLHYGALGAMVISGFWSLVNERWDPRTAKRYVGRIAAGGTVGGLLGGILAERVGALMSAPSMLPILAGLHLFCAWLVMGIRAGRPVSAPKPRRKPLADGKEEGSERSGLRVIASMPYLRGLVALVLLVTVGELLINYVFQYRAAVRFEQEQEPMLRFFAVFYAAIGLLTVVVQAAGSRFTLQRLGLTRTVALLPGGMAAGSVAALAVPGLASVGIARGVESVLRNGLYRPGYELLFTPIGRGQKRATKALVDVGVVRLGDFAGGAVAQGILLLAAAAVTAVLLGLAIALSAVAVVVALGLHAGYVRTLERSLLSRAIQLDLHDVQDATTRTAMLQSLPSLGLTRIPDRPSGEELPPDSAPVAVVGEPSTTATRAPPLDPEVARIVELRSRDAARVRAALQSTPLTPALVGHVVPLLAWDEVVREAIVALRDVALEAVGQLVDRMLDRDEEFAVRRRIPLVLAMCPTERAVEGLFRGLKDQRFEVRYRCGRALSRLLEFNPKLAVDREKAFAAALREVAVDRGVWESHRLLDRMEDEDWSPVLDEVLRDRADRSLEHVFTVLSLVLPRQPLKVAFRGLHTDDTMLRGTALEYLETALPENIRQALWPFLEDRRTRTQQPRSANEVLADLLESNQSIAINLEQLRKRKKEE
ncbi:MAG: hypothetical protein GTN62_12350 [Gemmatimonadales bacterium]|nr:hypothetical protein [Gemmatimonadales bacterium]NIN12516.1 hypothetical protein [Gemmatimonadales bacterium]NIN50887.1 hypothetical protein [Gemmatimonadales bacterium]NIP08351.1 hypothetical protein [Gemmatimonadales bacterium]NIR03448.1 hypothetical protein [Gemmatimonadales bacterium]